MSNKPVLGLSLKMFYLALIKILGLSFVISSVVSSVVNANDIPRSSSTADAQVFFVSPKDKAVVGETFTVKFGIQEMVIAPAGSDTPNSGHHHLIIDGKLPEFGLPMGSNVKHFGKGQTEAELTLSPGTHTLQLILGDKNHVPHNPPVYSEKITVTVR